MLLPLPSLSNQGLSHHPPQSQSMPGSLVTAPATHREAEQGFAQRTPALAWGRWCQHCVIPWYKEGLLFFFLYFIFSISHFILLYRGKKKKVRLATRRVISPFWKAAMSRWRRQQATSQPGLAYAQGRLQNSCTIHTLKHRSLPHNSHEISMDSFCRWQNPCPQEYIIGHTCS